MYIWQWSKRSCLPTLWLKHLAMLRSGSVERLAKDNRTLIHPVLNLTIRLGPSLLRSIVIHLICCFVSPRL
jgi:hypothetical protein